MQWYAGIILVTFLYISNGAVINVEIDNMRNINGNYTDVIKPIVDKIKEDEVASTSPPVLQDIKTTLNTMSSTLPPRIKIKEDSLSNINFILNPTKAALFKEKEDSIAIDTKPNTFCLKCFENHGNRVKPTETPRFYVKPIHSQNYNQPQYSAPVAPQYPAYPGGYPGYPAYPGYPGYPVFGGFPTALNPNIATVVTPNGNFTIISGLNGGFPNGINTGFPNNFPAGFLPAGFPTVFG